MLVQQLLAIPCHLDFFEKVDINLMVESLHPNNIKMNVTLEYIRMRTNLTIRSTSTIPKNATVKFTKNFFFHTFLSFRVRLDPNEFIQEEAGSHKDEKCILFTRIDEVQMKCNWINGSLVRGAREPIVYGFASDKPPGHKIGTAPRKKLFEINN